jgi:hypothetical protein
VQLNLSDERWDGVCRFAAEAYPGQPLAFGIREILLLASGLDPPEAAAIAARQAAYTTMTNMLRQRVLSALGPLLDTLQGEAARAAITAPSDHVEEKAA